MKEYSKIQPKAGDTIMLCGHGEERHAFFLPNIIKFQRPDGTKGQSSWIVCCHSCFLKYEIDEEMPNIRHDGKWKGNEPEFYHIYT